MPSAKLVYILFSLLLLASHCTFANATFTVAVASNFNVPLKQLIHTSPRWHTENIRWVVGSSGTLYSQSKLGAPFDVVLFANTEFAQSLLDEKLASDLRHYAQGKLVLWSPNHVVKPFKQQAKPVDAQFANSQFVSTVHLLNSAKRIAIADPQLAPYGQAAKSYLASIAALPALENKLILARNVSQAFQFVDSGNVDIGIVAESTLITAQTSQLAKAAAENKYTAYHLIDTNAYPPIVQSAVLLNSSKQRELAAEFMTFLRSSASQHYLSTLGYIPINEPDLRVNAP